MEDSSKLKTDSFREVSLRLLISLIAALAWLSGAPYVAANPGHERPRITVMRWKDPPVTTSSGECDPGGTCDEEILIVKAHDPDSSVTEVQVWFSENDDAGPMVFAHTFCVQGRKSGKTAHLKIGASYSEPGTYTVAAVAYSHKRCLDHERGDKHPRRHSRVTRLETEVISP